MNFLLKALFIIAICSMTPPCFASEESPIEFHSFSIVSSFDDIGEVKVVGRARDFGLEELEVSAFGMKLKPSKEVLSKLDKLKINGVSLTTDDGYSNVSGKELIVIFSTGYSSAVVARGFIVVRKSGEIKSFLRLEDFN